jgi:hypothetical protein
VTRSRTGSPGACNCCGRSAGLAWLLYIGSPQSKEGDERNEAKLDAILRKLDPKDDLIARRDREFHRT